MVFYDRIGEDKRFSRFLGLKKDEQGWTGWSWTELHRRPLPGFAGRWKNAARWWGTVANGEQMEIDAVAESTDGRTLLVGDAKLAMPEAEAPHRLADPEVKTKRLPFVGQYKQIESLLFLEQDAPAGAYSSGRGAGIRSTIHDVSEAECEWPDD